MSGSDPDGFFSDELERTLVAGRQARPGERLPEVTMLSVGSRYFDAIGVPLLRGRAFTNQDGGPGRQIAIVNQRLVDANFGDRIRSDASSAYHRTSRAARRRSG